MMKTLTIREEVYNKLVAVKGDRSFSQLLEDFADPKPFTGRDLEAFLGTIDEKEYRRLKKQSKDIRKSVSADLERRVKRGGA